MIEKWEYGKLYRWGEQELLAAGIEEYRLDARLLLEYLCQTNRNTLLAHPGREISEQELLAYQEGIRKRSQHIPLQYITGVQEFMGLTFRVTPDVLIPRQDTECLVEEAMRFMQDGSHILDMCTGSGCILLSLLYYTNDCYGVGVDISQSALQIARINAQNVLADKGCGVLDRVQFIQSDLFSAVKEEQFDLIVSNPPYIASKVIPSLMEEVRNHEPLLALDGKEDGLFFYGKILEESRFYLRKEGYLLVEIGYDQAEAVSQLMENFGFQEITIVKDLAGLDRVVRGVWMGFLQDERVPV